MITPLSEYVKILRNFAPLTEVNGLCFCVTESDITFVRLEIPYRYDEEISFSDSHPLLDLTRDPSYSGRSVLAHDPYLGCSEQLISYTEHLSFLDVRKTYTRYILIRTLHWLIGAHFDNSLIIRLIKCTLYINIG